MATATFISSTEANAASEDSIPEPPELQLLRRELHHELAVLDELQRRAPLLPATEVRMQHAALRHRVEAIDRRLPP